MKLARLSSVFLFACLLIGLATAPAFAQHVATKERPSMVNIPGVPELSMVERLIALDMDIAYVGQTDEGIHLVVDRDDLETLQAEGIPFLMMHDDVVAYFQSRFEYDPRLSRDLGFGSMGGFFTFSEVVAKLDEFRNDYPNLVTAKTSLGQSREGRDIWAVKISDNPDQNENEPSSIIDCLTHAREPQGMMSTLYFMNWLFENYPTDPMAKFLVEQREMWFVPVHNPDGYVYNEQIEPNGGGMWRKNRRYNNSWSYGVDLNRNWGYKWGYDSSGSSGNPGSATYRGPYSMSEPETQALANFISGKSFTQRLSVHCYGNMWIIPWCYERIYTQDDDLFRAVSQETAPIDYRIGTSWELLYKVNGGSVDWDYGDQGIMGYSPEMGTGADNFWPSSGRIVPIAEHVLPSLQYFFAIAGCYVSWAGSEFSEIVGNGNGYPEPDETLELVLTVANSGMADGVGPVSLSLTTTSPLITITSGTAQAPAIPSRDTTTNAGQPFVLDVSPAAVHGDTFYLDLEANFDGGTVTHSTRFIVGFPRLLVFDDMEDANGGWVEGLPSDTATSGIWERCNPNGTWSEGEPMAPENDATAGGTDCFVTGNAPPGSEAGDNDVDDGHTTLVTPLIDMTGGVLAHLGYSRWWANATGRTGVDDMFIIEVSNNNGQTWTQIEQVWGGKHNEWYEVEIVLENVIALTDQMRIRFVAEDMGWAYPYNSLVEAGIDEFRVELYSSYPVLSLFGKLSPGEDFLVDMAWDVGAAWTTYASLKKGAGTSYPGGIWYLKPTLYLLGTGTIGSSGLVATTVTTPNNPSLVGLTFYFQSYAVPLGGGDAMISNLTKGVVEP